MTKVNHGGTGWPLVTQLFNDFVKTSPSLGADQIVPELDRLSEVAKELVATEADRLEVKRRIAEWKLKLLCERDAEFYLVTGLYFGIMDLGFSTFGTEVTIKVYYAQYCVRGGRGDSMIASLQELRHRADTLRGTFDESVHEYFVNLLDRNIEKAARRDM